VRRGQRSTRLRPVWTIPAERMKMRKEHRVPLSDQALALLRALPRVKGAELVFPAPRVSAIRHDAQRRPAPNEGARRAARLPVDVPRLV